MNSKLILGTAQFQKNYGILKLNTPRKTEIINFFNTLKKNNIYCLDTSINYRNVDNKIKYSNFRKWKIITKINPKDYIFLKNKQMIKKKLVKSLNDHKKRMGVEKIDTILIQNVNLLIKIKNKNFIDALKELKKKNFFRKFGYSIYDFDDLKNLIIYSKPDVIQCPFNIIDRRLSEKKNINLIKINKIEVHVRSIFFQGLLLLDYNKLPKKILKWKKLFNDWNNWISNKKINKLDYCLSFVANKQYVDKLVLGINNLSQLQEIINFKFIKKLNIPKKISSKDKKLIIFRNW